MGFPPSASYLVLDLKISASHASASLAPWGSLSGAGAKSLPVCACVQKPKEGLGCGSNRTKLKIPKWVTLVSGNMDQNLRFAPPIV